MTRAVDHRALNFPAQRTCPYAPPREYAELREHSPVHRIELPNGSSAWLITRHEHVRAVLADTRFSSDRGKPGFPSLLAGQARTNLSGYPMMISMDPPEHSAARRAVLGEFTVRRMQALQPRIQRIVDDCLDAMLAGPRPADLVTALSLPVPSLVICELLGVPYADHDFFQVHTTSLVRLSTPPEERSRSMGELTAYLSELVSAKQAEPGDDLLGRQVLKQRENGTEDHGALVGLAFLLLLAGHETTANMISLGTLILLENPAALAAVRDDPALTPGAVEELLRYLTIVENATSRVATTDIEVGGTLIRAGEGVICLGHTADHDPEVFAEPERFDIARGARHHVAFGFGPHQCLGQNLARLELQVVFDTLLRRVPTLALATPSDQLPFKDDASVYGLYALPVTW
ncbi:cytochrome P450 [Saccharothrix coeruleofusca]|uniref:Cytochrome P450 n=1 Tax=Saccharothrix coeruleofusca TaxID=33919 RepID=A0A918ATN9_9PSEU|nr:cytochrome P450 [Saccharothrix coeruleofusca]MBP2336804.1 cytochrome P450 [Saccharothrix coeruleofusca]GGP82685.1 cytochrome P450 [Saccharothrix coeruleofusca]